MKIIVVVGGVISGVGKGVTVASIGRILKQHGYSVTAVKIDPYINYDAGTLRPTEHGEVWVTDDGGEIDQDLGNYERFLDINVPKKNNITTGQIYKSIIDAERAGRFLGQTVQFIPHVPEEIKRRVREASRKPDGTEYDFVIIEIGGTSGDYENLPFLFAMKSFEIELGKENVIYVLVSYLPVPTHMGEMKTKPTQQAIKSLNELGIFPDFVLCRAANPLDSVRKHKIETYALIPADHVISAPDVRSIYRIPLNFEKEELGKKILASMKLQQRKEADWSEWKSYVERIEAPSQRVKIAMVGKYLDIGDYSLADSYISISNALDHATAHTDIGVDVAWIDSKNFEKTPDSVKILEGFNGVIIPGGFGSSGVEGKIAACRFARENDIPYLGLCYGMQLAIVEFARNVAGLENANTTEVNPKTSNAVIDVLPTQREILEKQQYGGTMRLGAYAAMLDSASLIAKIYKETGRASRDAALIAEMKEPFRLGILEIADVVLERHRHRYEVNPKFLQMLSDAGIFFSGYHHRMDGTKLMEFMELKNHRYFVGTQAHPEFKSRINDPAPMFLGFVRACAK